MNVIDIISMVISVATSIIIVVVTAKNKRPMYTSDYTEIMRQPNNYNERLKIFIDDVQIIQLSKSIIRIWNEGRKTIRETDLLKDIPFGIKILDGDIIEFRYVTTKSMMRTSRVDYDNEDKMLKVTFDSMQKHEGMLIEILHTGKNLNSVLVVGDIDDSIKIKDKKRIFAIRSLFILISMLVISFIPYLFSVDGINAGKLFGMGLMNGEGTFFNRFASEFGIIGMLTLQLLFIIISLRVYQGLGRIYPAAIKALKIHD